MANWGKMKMRSGSAKMKTRGWEARTKYWLSTNSYLLGFVAFSHEVQNFTKR